MKDGSQANDVWNPKQYAKFQVERAEPFFDLLREIKAAENSDYKIADLGCGSGELTLKLAKQLRGRSVLGLDYSEAMLGKARETQKLFEDELRTKGEAPIDIRFESGSIEAWNPNETFDLIVSNAALHWCADHPTLLKNFRQHLNPAGQLAIQIPVNHDYPTHTVAMEMAKERHWIRLLGAELQDFASDILSPSEYADCLYHLGFSQQKVFVRVYAHVLESRDEVFQWVLGTTLTRFQKALAPKDFEAFLSEYRERLFQSLPDEKPFFYPFKRLFLIATL